MKIIKIFPVSWVTRGGNCRIIFCCLVVLCLAIPATGMCSVSGIYVASYKNGVAMIQLVETPDHHLTGNHMLVFVNTVDEVVTNSSDIVGAVDGSNISLGFSHGAKSITAVASGNNLRVIGLDNNPTVFQKSDIDVFEKKVAIIKATSQSALARKAEEAKKSKFISDIDELNGSMVKLITVTDKIVQELNETENHLQNITKKMATALEDERRLAGNQSTNAASTRMQLVSSIMQGRSVTQRLHWDFDALQAQFRNKQQPTYSRATELETACQKSDGISVCNKFLQTLPLYREKYAITEKHFDAWMAVYQKEKSSQDRIFEHAQAIQMDRGEKR